MSDKETTHHLVRVGERIECSCGWRSSGSGAHSAVEPGLLPVSLSRRALSTLITLCDARAHNLRKMIERGELADEDEISDAENDETYLVGLALMLREIRDGR